LLILGIVIHQAKCLLAFLLIVLTGHTGLRAQNIGYYRADYFKSYVTANRSGRLVSENEVYVKALRPNAGVDIVFNKLQVIQNFHVYSRYVDSDNYFEIEPVAEMTGAETDENYSGMSRLIVYLPDTSNYKIIYSLEADDPMLAGILNPVDENFDSLRYIYKIPEKYRLLYKIDGDSSRILHTMDKKTEEFVIYPKIKMEDYVMFASMEQFQMPVQTNLRVLILPAENVSDPEKYFADWYFRSLHDNNFLDDASRRFADSICNGITDSLEIMKTIFAYVNQKINYIGLFDTWNAFIPQNVNKVLQKRFGDCKNMANLLTSLLQYKGIRAYYGITASVYYPVEMDFPCLASGDHAICVVRCGGQWYFLDATNKLMLEMRPPGYIQGRTVLVLDESGPFYLKIPLLPVSQNISSLRFDLYCDSAGISGTFESHNSNYFRQNLLDMYYNAGNPVFSKMLPQLVIGVGFHYNTTNIGYTITDTSFDIGGRIEMPEDMITRLQNQHLALFPGFITVPAALTMSNRKFDMVTTEPIKGIGSYHFTFDHDVKLAEKGPVVYRKDGIVFEFSTVQSGPREIVIETVYELQYPVYRVSDLDNLNECSALIYNTMRDAIELE
jgi:hypothetical protein